MRAKLRSSLRSSIRLHLRLCLRRSSQGPIATSSLTTSEGENVKPITLVDLPGHHVSVHSLTNIFTQPTGWSSVLTQSLHLRPRLRHLLLAQATPKQSPTWLICFIHPHFARETTCTISIVVSRPTVRIGTLHTSDLSPCSVALQPALTPRKTRRGVHSFSLAARHFGSRNWGRGGPTWAWVAVKRWRCWRQCQDRRVG